LNSKSESHFRPYPWQVTEWQLFQRLYDTDKLPHAILISGPAEIGKREFGMAMIASLLCQQTMAGEACFQCKACALLTNGTHPDFLLAEPEEAGKAVKVDFIRSISEFAGKTAMFGGWRTVLIDPAEAMTTSAANALLKTLEEPGAKTLIILVHHQQSELLATVRSRCRLLALPMPASDLALDWLKGVCTTDDYDHLLILAGRRPLRAARLINEELLDQVMGVEKTLDNVATGEVSPVIAAEQCKSVPVDNFVEWVQNYHARSIVGRCKKDGPIDRADFQFADHLIFVRRQLAAKTNPNPQLLMEDLMFNWRRLKPSSS
jgi:DNA polymerase-3 subunit delta'